MILSILFAWLFIGLQVDIVITTVLIATRAPFRVTLRGWLMIILFWPDTVVALAKDVRGNHEQG